MPDSIKIPLMTGFSNLDTHSISTQQSIPSQLEQSTIHPDLLIPESETSSIRCSGEGKFDFFSKMSRLGLIW